MSSVAGSPHQKRYCWRSLKCGRFTFDTSLKIRFVSTLIIAKTDFTTSIKNDEEPTSLTPVGSSPGLPPQMVFDQPSSLAMAHQRSSGIRRGGSARKKRSISSSVAPY
jgi:hypothetical protein